MLWAASHYTVFDDEAFSCQRYVLPMGQMVSALWHGVEPDPPLYYVLQNLSVRVFGVGPLGLRALSIMMFLIGLVVMRAAAKAWFDRPTGIATLILCAIHPAHLFFGFAARWYSTMFLAVALLLWATGRMNGRRDGAADTGTGATPRQSRGLRESSSVRWWAVWAVAAAAVCYTNYFGPVVVGLVWIVSVYGHTHKRRWLLAALLAALLFTPWLAPFCRQTTSFPQIGGGWTAYLATAARTLMALLAGNLASHRAGYVWTPMVLFCMCICLLWVRQWRRVWPIAVITLGCFAAGVATRTMIDKYVMTFSGPANMLVAGLLVASWHDARVAVRRAARLAVAALALAWVGCGYNLFTERNWSSLRWLDPFDAVTRDCLSEQGIGLRITTHPSVHYYNAVNAIHAIRMHEPLFGWQSVQLFRNFEVGQQRSYDSQFNAYSPAHALGPLMQEGTGVTFWPRTVLTIETSEFADSPEWQYDRALLAEKYELAREEKHLEDPDAEWKDRLDPTFKHPRWRIVVRKWFPK